MRSENKLRVYTASEAKGLRMKKMHFMGNQKGLGKTLTIKKEFVTFTLSVNKIIIYQFSMFKSLDSIASLVGICMYLTISKFKQVLRSRKGLDYNTGKYIKFEVFDLFI